MKQVKILTYNVYLVLSNKYLQVIIKFLEPEIFYEKDAVLFNFLFYRIQPRFFYSIF